MWCICVSPFDCPCLDVAWTRTDRKKKRLIRPCVPSPIQPTTNAHLCRRQDEVPNENQSSTSISWWFLFRCSRFGLARKKINTCAIVADDVAYVGIGMSNEPMYEMIWRRLSIKGHNMMDFLSLVSNVHCISQWLGSEWTKFKNIFDTHACAVTKNSLITHTSPMTSNFTFSLTHVYTTIVAWNSRDYFSRWNSGECCCFSFRFLYQYVIVAGSRSNPSQTQILHERTYTADSHQRHHQQKLMQQKKAKEMERCGGRTLINIDKL